MPKPTSMMKKLCINGALIFALLALGTTQGIAFDKFNNTYGTAISGYDTVAYHTEERAMKGKAELSYKWNDANWHFASAENRNLFAADPERYAPQFGGYCTGSLSYGMIPRPNPVIFKIVDGKLYFANSTRWRNKVIGNQIAMKRAQDEWARFNKEH